MCIMCVTAPVQRFEPQGRRLTNYHYYDYDNAVVSSFSESLPGCSEIASSAS